MCNCLKQQLFDLEYNKSNVYQLAHQNFENFKFDFYSTKNNSEKYHSDLSPRENIKLIYDICQTFLEDFDDPTEKNLLFTGNTGLGKTFLSSCIANESLKKEKQSFTRLLLLCWMRLLTLAFRKYKSRKFIRAFIKCRFTHY